jgi:acetate kinase
MTPDQIERLLFRESGLLGLSGVSSDMRALEASTSQSAVDAIDHFVEQIVQQMGRLAAALRGVDGIVFTGGIGENAAALRERVLDDCAWLGVRRNQDVDQRREARLTADDSAVTAWVIRTDEEAVIARSTRQVLDTAAQ